MTKEEYNKTLKEIEIAQIALTKRKDDARAAFLLANSEFNLWDKVEIVWNTYKNPFKKDEMIPERRLTAYISAIHDKFFEGIVKYDFKAVRKDGTISQNGAGYISRYDRIELIEKAKTNQ